MVISLVRLRGLGKKIMKLRDVIACDWIRYVVGNGKSIWFWHDNWHMFGPLKKRLGSIVIYDATSKDHVKMEVLFNRAG